MSAECSKCGEHCLDCKCNTVMISGCPICEKCHSYSIHCKCDLESLQKAFDDYEKPALPFGFGSNYFQESTRHLCKESGHACSKWVDWKIYTDLKSLDEKDKGDRAKKYWKQCHSVGCVLSFKYGSTIPEVKIRCFPNNLRSCEFCDYTNDEVAKKLVNQLIECDFFKFFVIPPPRGIV